MRLGSVIDVLSGTLRNKPYISEFSGIESKISPISKHNKLQGALFFAINESDIAKAVSSGVYGIVSDKDVEIIDSEIAWIKVNNLAASIKRLARYLIVQSQLSIVIVTRIELSITKRLVANEHMICTANTLAAALPNFYTRYKNSSNIESKFIIASIDALRGVDVPKIYSNQYTRYIEATSQSEIHTLHKKQLKIFSHSLFETSIIDSKGTRYNIPLPFIFLPFIDSLFALKECVSGFGLDSSHIHNLHQHTHDFFDFMRFRGSHAKILIFCKNPSLLKMQHLQADDFDYNEEILEIMKDILEKVRQNPYLDSILTHYFDTQAPHLELLSLFRLKDNETKKRTKSSKKHNKLTFNTESKLYEIVSKLRFDIAIIYGMSKAEFIRLESSHSITHINQPSLFG